MLSDSESEVEPINDLTINEHYAKAFEYKKEREELAKLKEKYGSDYGESDVEESETDSESAESEDEDGEELTPAVDAAILRTLARIKRRDPEIYNTEKGIFEEEQQKTTTIVKAPRKAKDKSKPITIRQVALESALNAASRSPSPEAVPVPHVEEQRILRKETIAAFQSAVDDDDDLLIPREKAQDELDRDEEEYRAFLEREVGEDLAGLVTIEYPDGEPVKESESPKPKEKKKEKGKKKAKAPVEESKKESDQEFLLNYILNRGWIDRSTGRVPTYGEITRSESVKGKGKQKAEPEGDSDSEGGDIDADAAQNNSDLDEDDFEEIVDRFESSYNFRFEEPDAALIKSYPRNLPSLVRREDTTRKEARERRKQRKEEELIKKKEEVKRMKAIKMKDIRRKLEQIGEEGGKKLDEDAALRDLDLEGDWDPEAHDRQMMGLYGADDDGDLVLEDDEDGEKPVWDDDIDIGDIAMLSEDEEVVVEKKKKKKKKKKGGDEALDDGAVDMDAMDAEIERDDEEWDGTEEMRKKKLDEYMDEIYGLDFNDMVGDMPTRFKYAKVQPQNFALTPAEILMATDAELNEYMSVKKYAPYRKEARWDSTRNDRLKELKTKVKERTGGFGGFGESGAGQGAGETPVKKRKGKKERMKMKGDAPADIKSERGIKDEPDINKESPAPKRKRDQDDTGEGTTKLEDGINETGKKRRRRHGKKNELQE